MYLGLDLGTSGLKGLLIDDDQRVVAEATAPLVGVAARTTAGRSRSPADWIAAAEAVIGRAAGRARAWAVRGIGLSGQMHGATLARRLGRGAPPLHPLERHAEPC